jgi:homoserine O-acetyltransferase
MNYQDFISSDTLFYTLREPFTLECGQVLNSVQIAYRTWGKLNHNGDNGVLICHAFTGSADADYWWGPFFGEGKALNPQRDFIICSNIIGSCYGTTGPISLNPETNKPYGCTFPPVTIRDMVHLQAKLLDFLGVTTLKLVIGGSLGGMQVLEWVLLYPNRVEAIAPIAISGRHSPWCIGWSEAQRMAIYADPLWQNGNYDPDNPPSQGLAIARAIAMNTYRAWDSFNTRFGRQLQQHHDSYKYVVVSYLEHQGEKLVERFDANTYITLSLAMDSHDLTRENQDYESVLKSIKQPTLIVGIDTDILYPPIEQQELYNLIPNAELQWLKSPHGHDAFLIEMDELNDFIVQFRAKIKG